jgi:tetratricopeptide (TPR) repeat protein
MSDPREDLRIRFDAAVLRRKSRDLPGCIEELTKLAEEFPESVAVLWFLGGNLRQAGLLQRAISCLRSVVRLDPVHEQGSRNLFHALWAAGDREGAIAEMRRFLALAPSRSYSSILEAPNDEHHPGPEVT